MKLKVRIKFADPWAQVIPEVASQCGMTVEEYCRRAVQVLTKQGLDEGEKQNGKSGPNDPSRNADTVRASHAASSNALANPQSTESSPAP